MQSTCEFYVLVVLFFIDSMTFGIPKSEFE